MVMSRPDRGDPEREGLRETLATHRLARAVCRKVAHTEGNGEHWVLLSAGSLAGQGTAPMTSRSVRCRFVCHVALISCNALRVCSFHAAAAGY